MAYLDCLSGGRLIAGFVFGTPMDSTFSYGIPPIELRDRFHEARELILKAWEEPEPFAFNGKYTKLRYVNPWPQPDPEAAPPIWVPGSGTVETWDLVIDEDYCYGHLSFSGLHSAKPMVDALLGVRRQARRQHEPEPHGLHPDLLRLRDRRQAEREYAEAVQLLLHAQPDRPGFVNAARLPARSRRIGSADARARPRPLLAARTACAAARGEMSFWEYDEKGYIIAGTPERVRQRCASWRTTCASASSSPTLHMGNLAEEVAEQEHRRSSAARSSRTCATSGPTSEDHWTPEVSQQRVAARRAPRSSPAVGGAQ